MSDVDRIYAGFKKEEILVKSCLYEKCFIAIYDAGWPKIYINLCAVSTDETFILSTVTYLNKMFHRKSSDPQMWAYAVYRGEIDHIVIDYEPEKDYQNFWRVEEIVEDCEYFVDMIVNLYEMYTSGWNEGYSTGLDNAHIGVKEMEKMSNSKEEKDTRYFAETACRCVMKPYLPEIEKVIYRNPATIIFWKDRTKTVVKCQEEDTYDPQKGFMLCVMKKLFGNQGNYNNFLKKWCPVDTTGFNSAMENLQAAQMTITNKEG